MNEEQILSLFHEKAQKPLSLYELYHLFELTPLYQPQQLELVLESLVKKGELVKTRKDRYGLPSQLNLHIGRVKKTKSGYGFLIAENPDADDIFISGNDLKGAMNQDKVIVRILKPATVDQSGNEYKAEGEVIRILERYKTRIVGDFERSKHFGFVIPKDKLFDGDIFISEKNFNGAKTGDSVVVEITKWPERKRNAEGRIVEVFGHDGDIGLDVLSIIYQHGLRTEFNKKTLRQAERANRPLRAEDTAHRIDYRQLPLVTIDGADTKDFDDAVYVEKNDDGTFHLSVHIADVGHYVPENSALDKEAFRRGTSTYLVDRVIPMLPEDLSNGICSLNVGEDRLALSCVMQIDPNGRVLSYNIVEAVINVSERLIYDDVNRILEEDDPALIKRYGNLVTMIREMAELSDILTEKREKRGMIEFDLPETQVILDDEGKPIELKKRSRGPAERMIESFMIVANEVVAERFYVMGAPFIYRVHEAPEKEKVTALREFLYHYGITLPDRNGKVSSKDYAKVTDDVADDPKGYTVNMMLLRSMNHAYYSPDCLGHFGLASRFYTHFTAPIRRYSDLAIHRVIKEFIKGMPSEKRLEQMQHAMARFAEQASQAERVAEEAERDSVALKKAEFMADKIGEVYSATVISVTGFGLFVQLENSVAGLIHISTLVDDFYQYDSTHQRLIGENSHNVFELGQVLKVELVDVNVPAAQIDFELIEKEGDIEETR